MPAETKRLVRLRDWRRFKESVRPGGNVSDRAIGHEVTKLLEWGLRGDGFVSALRIKATDEDERTCVRQRTMSSGCVRADDTPRAMSIEGTDEDERS